MKLHHTVRSTVRSIALVTALMVTGASCSGDGGAITMAGSETTAADSDRSTATTAAPTIEREGSIGGTKVSWELPRTTLYGNIRITAESAERRAWFDTEATEDDDEDVDWVVIDLKLENLAQDIDWSFPAGVLHLTLDDGTRIDGEPLEWGTNLDVQMGNTSTTGVAFQVDSGASLDGASLAVYETDRHPAVIPLDGKYEFEDPEPVPVSISPGSVSSGGTVYCALGPMGGTSKWDITDIEAFAVRDQPLTPADAPGGAGDFTEGPGGGSGTRASTDSALLVVRATVTEFERPNGATGCSPRIDMTADGITVESATWNLSTLTYSSTVTNGTAVIQWTFDVPVDTTTIAASFGNPKDVAIQIDPSFLQEFGRK